MAKVIEVWEIGNTREITVEGASGKTRTFTWGIDKDMTAKQQAREAILLVESEEAKDAPVEKVYTMPELDKLNEGV